MSVFSECIPHRWRWAHKIYAFMNGYFWLPCPICHEDFGGHEWRESLYLSWDTGKGVCRNCESIAAERNKIFFASTPPPPRYMVASAVVDNENEALNGSKK